MTGADGPHRPGRFRAAENQAAGREDRKPVGLPHMVTHDLGHFAPAVSMLRIYAHLWPGEKDRTRTVMDAVLGGLRTGCELVDQATKEIAGQAA
ncbi:hypothetical protein [Streptomyces sp. NPDC055134]